MVKGQVTGVKSYLLAAVWLSVCIPCVKALFSPDISDREATITFIVLLLALGAALVPCLLVVFVGLRDRNGDCATLGSFLSLLLTGAIIMIVCFYAGREIQPQQLWIV